MSTKKKRSRKKQKVYTVHWPILMGLTALLVALVLLVVGVIRACALPEGDALSVEETPEPIIPAPTWSPLPVDINFTKVHNTYVKVFMQDEGEIRDIVKEQALELLRHQMLQLAPGTVQQHAAQRADLAADGYRHGITSPLLFYLLFEHFQPL